MTYEQYEAARKVIAARYVRSDRKRIKVRIQRDQPDKRKD